MPPKTPHKKEDAPQPERILGRVASEEFVGRADELQQIVRHASRDDAQARGLLLLLAPSAGVSELLRQAYDHLFNQRGNVIPLYYALTRNDRRAAHAARQFLHAFLQQLIAFRRNDPSLIDASLTLKDVLELAPPSDYEWIERLVESTERERASGDERALVRLCFGAPQRAAKHGARVYVMLDGAQLVEHPNGEVSLGAEIVQSLLRMNAPYVLAGLRRQILDLVHSVRCGFEDMGTIHLERLSDRDARALVERVAQRAEVSINEQTRDLVVQQFGGSPFFITALISAARDRNIALTSFLNCQQLYVDELMGGRISRYFSFLLEEVAPQAVSRRTLVRLLYEAVVASGSRGKSPVEVWRKKMGLEDEQFQRVMRGLHVHELVSLNSDFVETSDASSVWGDYLRARYRMEIGGEPRALVVAQMLVDCLKRAPQTMARHYRREAALGLRELIARFNCQRVPASLLHYDRFSRVYKGVSAEETAVGLDTETDLVRLPQIVHVASCTAFHSAPPPTPDDERCAVAHGFDAANYMEANEVVWLAAEIESKMEAGRGLTEMWCDRLTSIARTCGFNRVHLWLVAPEGFSTEASELLNEREAYGSSRQQLELLTARISSASAVAGKDEVAPNEFELAIPMGDDTELIAAHTVEQIARRIDFPSEAINQIKTALIEACINATEHSLSPDRKIYQRFRVESDRLVVTVSSRGVVPPNINNGEGEAQAGQPGNGNSGTDSTKGRRGWGLKLIRSLMDEVEFERVDDGTRLRMTKYLKKSRV
ncbi:MAG TPA: ATP-binding protein [Pyrinomonadaceae bacterium]|jgi:serine/threonine-protein kinase RsbW